MDLYIFGFVARADQTTSHPNSTPPSIPLNSHPPPQAHHRWNDVKTVNSTMATSSPSFSFTIPSVHDGCKLQCRIYLPYVSGWLENIESALARSVRGAIVAHPYAPLGGCYDDPVVSFLSSELLQQGYIVGTFNFR